MRPSWRCLYIILAAAGAVHGQQLPVKTYAVADGLASDRVNCIAQDSRGFLWIGTSEGLSRFDGSAFTNYTRDQGLPHDRIWHCLITRDNQLWLATPCGVCRFDPAGPRKSKCAVYRVRGGWEAATPTTLLEDHAGNLWCGTTRGLVRLPASDRPLPAASVEFRPADYPLPESQVVSSLLEDRKGTLWAGTEDGLYGRRSDGSIVRFGVRDGLPDRYVGALLAARGDRLWVGTHRGLCRINPDREVGRPLLERLYRQRDGLLGEWIDTLLAAEEDKLWLGVAGLQELDPNAPEGEQLQTYTTAQGLSNAAVHALFRDREGNLWAGTDRLGVMKIARGGLTTYTKTEGVGYLSSLFETPRGELCAIGRVPTNTKLLVFWFDGKRFHAAAPAFPRSIRNFGWGGGQIGLQDRWGEWWIATGEGLFRFPATKRAQQLAGLRPKAVYGKRDGLSGNEVFRVFEDSASNIWVGMFGPPQSSLARWDRRAGIWQSLNEPDPGVPTAFASDRAGNVWIGFWNGSVARYRDGRFTSFPEATAGQKTMVLALFCDRAGRLWVGTSSYGVIRVEEPDSDQPRFVHWTTADGLSSNQIAGFADDPRGGLYVATGRGVDRLATPGLAAPGAIRHYTTADGLARGEIQHAYGDRHGDMWIIAQQGLSRLISEPEQPRSAPPVFVTGLSVGGAAFPVSDWGETQIARLRLRAGQGPMRIEFAGVSMVPGDVLRYQDRLGTGEWSLPSDQRAVTYANLAAGTYRFEVRAVNADGIATPRPATVEFVVLPRLWESWWFELLAVLATTGLVYWVYRIRVMRLVELERVRARIATDLHDDIGASLSHIAVLSEVAASEVARLGLAPDQQRLDEPLARIGSVSRELIDSMSDIVWAISPRKDRLQSLTQRMREFAGEILGSRSMEFDLRAAGIDQEMKLDPEVRRQVFLVFKECVNNIVRHSGSTRVLCDLQIVGRQLVLRLSDNGRGFGATGANGPENGGQGLASMRRRAEALGGSLAVATEPNQGVTVILRVPIT